MKFNWNFQRGGGALIKSRFSGGDMDILQIEQGCHASEPEKFPDFSLSLLDNFH